MDEFFMMFAATFVLPSFYCMRFPFVWYKYIWLFYGQAAHENGRKINTIVLEWMQGINDYKLMIYLFLSNNSLCRKNFFRENISFLC